MWIIPDKILISINIKKNNYCYCGSTLSIKNCCDLESKSSWIWDKEFENIDIIYKKTWNLPLWEIQKLILKNYPNHCLEIDCSEDSIRSHTISKSRMKKHFTDWHVASLEKWENNDFIFKRKSINKVTWFMGRCSKHDWSIFKDIDKNFTYKNKGHCNLLALRSIAKEMRDKENALKVYYSFFLRYKNDITFNFLLSWYKWYIEFTKFYRFILNWIRANANWQWLIHKTIQLWKIKNPLFLTNPITPYWTHIINNLTIDLKPLIFSIITDEEKNCIIIFSYHHSDTKAKSQYLKFNKAINKKDYNFVNQFISDNCSNIASYMWNEWETIAHDQHNIYQTEKFNYLIPEN